MAGRQDQGRLLQKGEGRRRQGRRTARAGLENAGIPSAAETEVSCPRYGEECRGYWRASAYVAGAGRQRPAEERQGGRVSLGGALRSVDLLRQPRAGNFRLRGGNRPRH